MANVESTLVTENRNKLVIKKKTLQEDLDQVCAMLKLATSSFTGFGNPVTNSSPPRDSQISSRSAGSDKKKQNNRSRDSQSSTASVPDTNHSSTQSPPSHSPNNAIHEDTKRKNESAKDASKSPPSRVFGAMNAPIMHLHDDTDHDAFIDATANTSTNESEIKRLSESYGY